MCFLINHVKRTFFSLQQVRYSVYKRIAIIASLFAAWRYLAVKSAIEYYDIWRRHSA